LVKTTNYTDIGSQVPSRAINKPFPLHAINRPVPSRAINKPFPPHAINRPVPSHAINRPVPSFFCLVSYLVPGETECPGEMLYQEMKKWPHWADGSPLFSANATDSQGD
jgi:hypothetical protein